MITFKRITQVEELAILQSVSNQTWFATYADTHSQEQLDYMMQMMYSTPVLEKEFNEGVLFCLTYDKDQPIGFISVGMYNPEILEAKLHKLYLLKSYHGLGVGEKMMQQAKMMALELGAKHLRLSVNKANKRAQRFYEKQNFQCIKAELNDIGRGFYMNDYVFQCPLS